MTCWAHSLGSALACSHSAQITSQSLLWDDFRQSGLSPLVPASHNKRQLKHLLRTLIGGSHKKVLKASGVESLNRHREWMLQTTGMLFTTMKARASITRVKS